MITLEVNQRPIQAKAGETILCALQRAGIKVPTLCHMEDLPPSGACRLCVVEVEGEKNLVPSCAFPVADGMRIQTHSPRALRARKTLVELLLASHPDECLYCVRNRRCRLQDLAEELGVRRRRYVGERNEGREDTSSPSLVRDPAKCVLCGRCVRVCEEVQGVAAIGFVGRGRQARISTAFDRSLNASPCVQCGQCLMVCPTGALREQSHLKEVVDALADPDRIVVAQHDPAVSVTLAEEFGLKPGADVAGPMAAALRQLGFDRVFDTSFAADLMVMEEASELVARITRQAGPLPLLTSCSPGWVQFVGESYPDLLPNLSTSKSPPQMMGALIKSHFAQREGVDPARIFSVSITPCTARKSEAVRPEMMQNGLPDIDAVLTTRELARLIHMRGLHLITMEPEGADTPFAERSSAGKLFGTSGGVTEAVLRTAYQMITGKELPGHKVQSVRSLKGLKETHLRVGGLDLGVAVASGLGHARRLVEEIRAGRRDLHFVEVMTCPGGCIAGGGQPLAADPDALRARMQALYNIDRDGPVRTAHGNKAVRRLYEEFLGKPLGQESHRLLHTNHGRREATV